MRFLEKNYALQVFISLLLWMHESYPVIFSKNKLVLMLSWISTILTTNDFWYLSSCTIIFFQNVSTNTMNHKLSKLVYDQYPKLWLHHRKVFPMINHHYFLSKKQAISHRSKHIFLFDDILYLFSMFLTFFFHLHKS